MLQERPTAAEGLSCPDCRVGLEPVTSGGAVVHRCGRCRGVWLDPDAFQRPCRQEEHALGEEKRMRGWAARTTPRDPSLDDTFDVLVGGEGSWDVPSKVP